MSLPVTMASVLLRSGDATEITIVETALTKHNVVSIQILSNLTYFKELLKGPKKYRLLAQVNYNEKCGLGDLKGRSLITGGL